MAIVYQSIYAAGELRSSGTTLTLALNNTAGSGGVTIILCVGFDNTGTSTPTVSSISKPAGETANWSLVTSCDARSATSGDSQRAEMWRIDTTPGVNWSTSLTVTFSGTITAKAGSARTFTGVGTLRAAGAASSGLTSLSSSTLTPSITPAIGDLVVAFAAQEDNAALTNDSDSVGGTWGSASLVTTGGGGAGTHITTNYGHKIPTSAGTQNFGPTTLTGDNALIMAVFAPGGPAQFTASGTVPVSSALSGAPTARLVSSGTVPVVSVVSGFTTAAPQAVSGTVTVVSGMQEYVPVARQNTFETGLAEGTIITVANSDDGAAGDAFVTVQGAGGTIGTDNTIYFSTLSPLRGSLSGRWTIKGTDSGSTYVRMSAGGQVPTLAVRFYFRVNGAIPTGDSHMVRILSNTTQRTAGLRLMATGALQLTQTTGTGLYTPTDLLSVDTWYRVEIWATPGTTSSTGRVGYAVYVGHDTTPYFEFSSTTANLGTVQAITSLEVGKIGTPDVDFDFSVDDYAVNTQIGEAFIGPSVVAITASGTVGITSTTSGTAGLSGAVSGTVSVQSTASAGAVTARLVASGTNPIVSTTAGNAPAIHPVTGTVTVVSTTAGDAQAQTPANQFSASGTVTITSTVAGDAPAKHPVTGTVSVVSTTAGDAPAKHPVTGTANVVSATSGAVGARLAASGTVTLVTTLAGDAPARHPVSGTTTIVSAVTGAVAARYPVGGTVAIVTATSGTALPPGGSTGTLPIITTTSGAVGARLATAGVVTVTSTVVGTPVARHPVTGTSPLVSSVVGTVGAARPTTGSVVVVTSTTGAAVMWATITGLIEIISQVSGGASGTGVLLGIYYEETPVETIYYGSTPVIRVYYGTDLIWGS